MANSGHAGSHLLHKYGTNELKVLTFTAGDTEMAINVAKVIKVLSFENYPIFPISAIQVPYFIGNIDILGQLVPVIDLVDYLGYSSEDSNSNKMGIVTEFDGQKIAFKVSNILQNMTLSWSDVTPVKEPIAQVSIINGQILQDDKIILFLDFENVRDYVMGNNYHIDEVKEVEPNTVSILYAEDSVIVREVVVNNLEKKNYKVTQCENGMVAWENFQIDPKSFDLILSDIEMPQKDGTSLVADIRAHPEGKDIPIILMSSMTVEQNIQQYLDIGASAFVPKNNMGRLKNVMEELLSKETA